MVSASPKIYKFFAERRSVDFNKKTARILAIFFFAKSCHKNMVQNCYNNGGYTLFTIKYKIVYN